MRREKAHGTVTESLCRIGVRKKEAKAKRQDMRERERERENGIDCFVSRDSSERRAVIKINRVFILV